MTDTRHRRFLGWLAGLSLAFGLLPLVLAMGLGPLGGDLGRIGAWSAADYGWRVPQPPVTVAANMSTALAPDVLVLGDSFSEGNVWQSVWMHATGLKVHTVGFGGHGCIEAVVRRLESGAEPQVRHLVIQTIERHLLDRFRVLQGCPEEGPKPFPGPAGVTRSEPPQWPPVLDWRHLRDMWVNRARVTASPDDIVRAGDTVNWPLHAEGRFSNRRSDRLLTFLGDDFKSQWTNQDIARSAQVALTVQQRVQATGRGFTVLVVPDKSRVYRDDVSGSVDLPPAPSWAPVWQAAGVALAFPADEMRQAAVTRPDFFWPDDTHLSPWGFRWLGQWMAQRGVHVPGR